MCSLGACHFIRIPFQQAGAEDALMCKERMPGYAISWAILALSELTPTPQQPGSSVLLFCTALGIILLHLACTGEGKAWPFPLVRGIGCGCVSLTYIVTQDFILCTQLTHGFLPQGGRQVPGFLLAFIPSPVQRTFLCGKV